MSRSVSLSANRVYGVRRVCEEQVKKHRRVKEPSVLIEPDTEGYYVATVPALRGCHTQARSLDRLMARIQETIELCLEVEGGGSENLDFVGVQKVTVS